MSDDARSALAALVADDEDGLFDPVAKPEPVTNADILANRFQEINEFIDTHNRNPDPANREDIGEFQLGHRLQAVLENPEYRKSLEHLDRHNLFAELPADSLGALLADGDLFDDDVAADLFDLKHVPAASKNAPDKVASGTRCEDFDTFAPLFASCHADLREGRRDLKPFRNPSNIRQGAFYVQRGMLVYVAEVGELTQKKKGADGRLRCIYENGTESDLLLHSLARALYEEGKIVTEPNDAEIEILATPEHVETGFVYVARTLSEDPQLSEFQHLHKIGYTQNEPAKRVAGAAKDQTFLNAPATLTADFEMPKAYAKFTETALHNFFSAVRLDITYDDGTTAQEWVDASLQVIEQSIDLAHNGKLVSYRYNPESLKIELA